MKNVVQDLTSDGIDWQREKWQSGLGSKFIHQGEKNAAKDRIGKSYNDYIAGHQMNLFEDFIGYQGSAVLDEPEQKTDTISVPIPQCEESENIPLSDFPEQPENVQRPGSEVVEKGMLT